MLSVGEKGVQEHRVLEFFTNDNKRQGSIPNEGIDSNCTPAVPPTFLEPELENSPNTTKCQGHPTDGTSVGGPPRCVRRRPATRQLFTAPENELQSQCKSPDAQSDSPKIQLDTKNDSPKIKLSMPSVGTTPPALTTTVLPSTFHPGHSILPFFPSPLRVQQQVKSSHNGKTLAKKIRRPKMSCVPKATAPAQKMVHPKSN